VVDDGAVVQDVIEFGLVGFAALAIHDDDTLDAGISRADEHAEVDAPRIEHTIQVL
jgi:hypothetical protein